ncbi:MAG TPA: hypothetical protein VER79_06975 [Candidatus Limnocylindrales bacterium]|nr:hypothetical protein [Candidatus Limnocylindrales bacterium]
MADSLFDNRYRYDHIFPRGRSGETLRAVDTQAADRPVVVKRPAPQDAPPIRAGQEVSITNERKALTRLNGHAVATALIGGGQFVVGGVTHQYIVVERAQGLIIADLVLELASRGERVAELELLVITDALLDLLGAAHAAEIVYNDVDAKHLFWNRDTYTLKVIDWGNAVFLEGDEATPQGIGRQTDIYQVGELLYFVVTGGRRADQPRAAATTASEDYRVDFGEDNERLHPRIQAIISRALHPNPRYRYKTTGQIRKELADYRAPLERERNAVLGRVNERLRRELSRDELNALLRTLEPVLLADPGFPAARQAQAEVYARLSDLQVAADLDAVRIYLDSANWGRAIVVLDELRPRSRGDTAVLIGLLYDWSTLLLDNDVRAAGPLAVTPAMQQSFGLAFTSQFAEAARVLLTIMPDVERARAVQVLMAERISAHVPDVLLLRPSLYRLEVALAALAAQDHAVAEPRAFLAEINRALFALTDPADVSLITLRDGYRAVVDRLTALGSLLDSLQGQHQFSSQALPLNALVRAMNAAMALADNMHVIGKQATGSPRAALEALDHSRQIAPGLPAWEQTEALLNSLYERLEAFQSYIPAADGSDVAEWIDTALSELEPYAARLFDEALDTMIGGLNAASAAWEVYADAVIAGGRADAVTALISATDGVSMVSPSFSNWLNQLRIIVADANYVERHALFGALGRALADGWEHFDRGRLAEAERLGAQAIESSRTETQRFVSHRLHELAQITREWLDRGGPNDPKRSEAVLVTLEALYTANEIGVRDHFNAQMPSKDTYLRAMSKGLVEMLGRDSSAGPRILFVNQVLLGVLDANDQALDDARFWRDAASRVLLETGPAHPLVRMLEELIDRRRDLMIAAAAVNNVTGPAALPGLESTRKAIEENPQSRLLQPVVYSLRELEAALRDWSEGEFRAAGMKVENALHAAEDAEKSAQTSFEPYRTFLMDLLRGAADLHANSRRMAQIIEAWPETPPEQLRIGHALQADVTARMLGNGYAGTLRQWRDTYEAFSSAYIDPALRRSPKLARLNELFNAMFIDRHPSYSLYRTWYGKIEQAPEFPAPPTDEPVPRLDESAPQGAPEAFPTLVRAAAPEERAKRRSRPLLLGALLLAVLVIITAVVVLSGRGGAGMAAEGTATNADLAQAAGTLGVTVNPASLTLDSVVMEGTETNPPAQTGTAARTMPPTLASNATAVVVMATIPPRASETVTPAQSTTATASPSRARTSTATSTATTPPTVTNTSRPTLPPQGLQGQQALLSGPADDVAAFFSSPAWFVPAQDPGQWRLGAGEGGGGELLVVAPAAEAMNARFGADAAGRVVRTQADLQLITYNPPLLVDNDVYFGLLLQSVNNPANTAGLQIELAEAGVIRLSHRDGDTVTSVSQRTQGGALSVRLERDLDANTVRVFVNGQPLGGDIPFVDADEPVVPLLYVHDGGVIAHAADWSVTLR